MATRFAFPWEVPEPEVKCFVNNESPTDHACIERDNLESLFEMESSGEPPRAFETIDELDIELNDAISRKDKEAMVEILAVTEKLIASSPSPEEMPKDEACAEEEPATEKGPRSTGIQASEILVDAANGDVDDGQDDYESIIPDPRARQPGEDDWEWARRLRLADEAKAYSDTLLEMDKKMAMSRAAVPFHSIVAKPPDATAQPSSNTVASDEALQALATMTPAKGNGESWGKAPGTIERVAKMATILAEAAAERALPGFDAPAGCGATTDAAADDGSQVAEQGAGSTETTSAESKGVSLDTSSEPIPEATAPLPETSAPHSFSEVPAAPLPPTSSPASSGDSTSSSSSRRKKKPPPRSASKRISTPDVQSGPSTPPSPAAASPPGSGRHLKSCPSYASILAAYKPVEPPPSSAKVVKSDRALAKVQAVAPAVVAVARPDAALVAAEEALAAAPAVASAAVATSAAAPSPAPGEPPPASLAAPPTLSPSGARSPGPLEASLASVLSPAAGSLEEKLAAIHLDVTAKLKSLNSPAPSMPSAPTRSPATAPQHAPAGTPGNDASPAGLATEDGSTGLAAEDGSAGLAAEDGSTAAAPRPGEEEPAVEAAPGWEASGTSTPRGPGQDSSPEPSPEPCAPRVGPGEEWLASTGDGGPSERPRRSPPSASAGARSPLVPFETVAEEVLFGPKLSGTVSMDLDAWIDKVGRAPPPPCPRGRPCFALLFPSPFSS